MKNNIMEILIVLITAPTKKEARKISNILLDKKIIACSNIIENIESKYWWLGKKEKSKEVLIIAKTTGPLFAKLTKIVKLIHSYKVPEIIGIPVVSGHKPYLDWIKSVCLGRN